MVIANEVVNENYFLISLNGHGKSERDIFILGINIHFFFINSVKFHYEIDVNYRNFINSIVTCLFIPFL